MRQSPDGDGAGRTLASGLPPMGGQGQGRPGPSPEAYK